MTTNSPQRIALVTAATLTVAWIVCSVIYALLPALGMNVMGSLYHMPMPLVEMSWGGFFTGLVAVAIAGYLVGYLFAVLLDYGRKQTN
jgi:hypothetical protein